LQNKGFLSDVGVKLSTAQLSSTKDHKS